METFPGFDGKQDKCISGTMDLITDETVTYGPKVTP